MATVVNAGHRKIATIDNYYVGSYKCSATVGMFVKANCAYCIKTSHQPDGQSNVKLPVVFHEFRGITNPSIEINHWTVTTENGETGFAKHANSLTNANGYFYIATMNPVGNGPQVVGFKIHDTDTPGKILKSYTYTSVIYSINHYETVGGVKYFLVCVDRNDTENYYVFKKVHISGTTFVDDNVSFRVYDSGNYNDGNDSYYDIDTKMLYTTRFYKPSSGYITQNVIFQYNLVNGITGTGGTYQPCRSITLANDTEEKFEVEGMGIYGTNPKKYICANIKEVGKSEGDDAIYSNYAL